jgi:hypothetical protein
MARLRDCDSDARKTFIRLPLNWRKSRVLCEKEDEKRKNGVAVAESSRVGVPAIEKANPLAGRPEPTDSDDRGGCE